MKRGSKKIITGLGIIVIGVFVIPAVVGFYALSGAWMAREQFAGPGVTEVTVDEPGQYYLWNDFRTEFDGKTYNSSESIPDGWEIAIRDSAKEPLELLDGMSMAVTIGSDSRNTIGYVEVDRPSVLEIEVSGGTEERIFSFAESDPSGSLGMFMMFLGAVGLAFVSGIVGLGVLIWGCVNRFSAASD